MLTEPQQAPRNILGYTLKQKIGTGSFGEVWSAEAPGGMPKAVKIVYGYHNEKRAMTELKSLNRVKTLRHPFLLSLERIEVFEGQLIIVSELADQSLADLFNAFAAKGEVGIPREQLLRFIRDAADALDYLSREHGLQHLDVKPENLLVIGDHVKVADFGLTKKLRDATQSLMSGMTPAYAAPEMFDGRPSAQSDQYSLAIVYQEMLTGTRPFPGSTPAQLAAQHMHGKPNLRALPKGDQDVIVRALSKDPGVRFESCRAMAEELSNRKRSIKRVAPRAGSLARTVCDTDQGTIALEQGDATALVSSQSLPLLASKVKMLDPPDCDSESATVEPTLVIGVGATANRVVQQIKQLVAARYRSMDQIPALRVVCVDTDQKDLAQLGMTPGHGGLTSDESLAIPLSKPEDYRNRQDSHLRWLSRRWIYNIPRSLQTEGLRPLGRLAFADHFETICGKLDQALDTITQPERIAQSAQTLEMNPGSTQPRVFIVSSISGGTGSGMVLDLAYTVKLLLAEHGWNMDTVTGILFHSTYQRSREPGLSAANAFALMTEMRHYIENGYPGDDSIGIPEFENEPPFDATYYVELGNDLSQTDYQQRVGQIAEYICLNTLSKCGPFFDQCRQLENESETGQFSLRTFGLSVTDPGTDTSGEAAVEQLAYALVQKWIQGSNPEMFDPTALVRPLWESNQLAREQVVQRITTEMNQRFEETLKQTLASVHALAEKREEAWLPRLIELWDRTLGDSQTQPTIGQCAPDLCQQLEVILDFQCREIVKPISESILGLLTYPRLDLSQPRRTVELWKSQFQTEIGALQEVAQENRDRAEEQIRLIQDHERALMDGRKQNAPEFSVADAVSVFSTARLQEFLCRYAVRYYQNLLRGIGTVEEQIEKHVTDLGRVAQHFVSESDWTADLIIQPHRSIDQLLSESAHVHLERHRKQAEVQIYESLVKDLGGFDAILHHGTCLQVRLPIVIREIAQNVLVNAYKKVSLEEVIAQHNIAPEQLVKWLTEKIQEARPRVNDCGGGCRIMLGRPVHSEHSELAQILHQQFQLNVAEINGTQGSHAICFEGESLSLANVAYRLLQACPEAVELVKRIASRTDIEWSSLNELL